MGYIKIIFYGILGGVSFWVLMFSLPNSGSIIFNLIRADLINYLGKEPVLTPTPIIASSEFWQKIVSDHVLNTVAVQSFKDGKMIWAGSGMIISSDGVIITTFDVVAGADVFQVLYGDKILRAQLVRYDGLKNLALLKINTTNLNVTRLERNYQFQPGQDVIISGKMVEFSNPVVFAQRGMIGYVLSKDIVVNTQPSYFLSGSKAINSSGVVIGMSYLRSSVVHMIKAETMDDFIKNYFESID